MRKVLQYKLNRATVIGTVHQPSPVAVGSGGDRPPGIGLLLLSFAQAPRAGVGDLSPWIGDRVAELGIPVFRFDLPGLGESHGQVPDLGQPMWEFIREGGHVPWAVALVDALRDEYEIDQLIVGGLCAGTVTALYTAAKRPDAVCGVLLLEPIFHLSDEPPERDPLLTHASGTVEPGIAARLKEGIRARLSDGRAMWLLQTTYTWYKLIKDRALGKATPPDAILPLLRAWKSLVSARTRMLLVSAGYDGRASYYRIYLGPFFDRKLTWVVVPSTNHMLAAHGGKDGVTRHVLDWLEGNYLTKATRGR